MPIEYLVDRIRFLTQERNVATHQKRGRGLVARVLFDKSFEQALAAERAGKLEAPAIDEARTRSLREKYGADIDVVVEAAKLELPYWPAPLLMSATQAVKAGLVPPFKSLTAPALEQIDIQARSKGMELEWISLNPGNLRKGAHLRFVRTGGTWYALEDLHLKDGTTRLTAEFNGTVFRYRDKNEDDGTHRFLAHMYVNGTWHLGPCEHCLADEGEMDMPWAVLAFGPAPYFLASEGSSSEHGNTWPGENK